MKACVRSATAGRAAVKTTITEATVLHGVCQLLYTYGEKQPPAGGVEQGTCLDRIDGLPKSIDGLPKTLPTPW